MGHEGLGRIVKRRVENRTVSSCIVDGEQQTLVAPNILQYINSATTSYELYGDTVHGRAGSDTLMPQPVVCAAMSILLYYSIIPIQVYKCAE